MNIESLYKDIKVKDGEYILKIPEDDDEESE